MTHYLRIAWFAGVILINLYLLLHELGRIR